MVTNLILLL